jgi:hypothetical protein
MNGAPRLGSPDVDTKSAHEEADAEQDTALGHGIPSSAGTNAERGFRVAWDWKISSAHTRRDRSICVRARFRDLDGSARSRETLCVTQEEMSGDDLV